MESSGIIRVTVKTLKQKEQFEVAQGSTVRDFKEEVAKRFKTDPDLLILVFAGKILQDQDTLNQHGVCSGVRIHMVIRSQKRPQDGLEDQGRAAPLMQPPSNSNSFYFGSTAGLGNPCLLPQNLAQPLITSQEIVAETMENLLSRILSSGLDLNTISNNSFLLGFLLGVTGVHLLGLDSADMSDLVGSIRGQDVCVNRLLCRWVQEALVQNILDNIDFRELIMSNPQMQQLAEESPEICHILTDPQAIREMLEASSSDAVMQEMIRNNDLAINNLESIPGGFRALEQLYREVEEPILDALQEQLSSNPTAALDSSTLSEDRLPAHTENCRPLPNPWAPQPSGADEDADEPDGPCPSRTASGRFAPLHLGPAAGPVVPNSGEAVRMVQQLTGNPELMHNLESALTDPNSPAQRLLSSTHLSGGGSSSPQDQWAQQLPLEMENTEISSLLRNPRALQALLQIQLGLQTLSREEPDFILSLEDQQVDLDLESVEDSTTSSEYEDALSTPDDDETEGEMEMDEEEPQDRFESQMQQLSAMGFLDQRANLQALLEAEGDVGAAVEILRKTSSSEEAP